MTVTFVLRNLFKKNLCYLITEMLGFPWTESGKNINIILHQLDPDSLSYFLHFSQSINLLQIRVEHFSYNCRLELSELDMVKFVSLKRIQD